MPTGETTLKKARHLRRGYLIGGVEIPVTPEMKSLNSAVNQTPPKTLMIANQEYGEE